MSNIELEKLGIKALPIKRIAGSNLLKPIEERHYALPIPCDTSKGIPCATIEQLRNFMQKSNAPFTHMLALDVDGVYLVDIETGSISTCTNN